MNYIYKACLGIAIMLLLASCKKEINTIESTIVDNYIYETGTEEVYQSNAEKDKQKTANQYISILYANLYRTAINQQELTDLSEVRLAMGDKQLADEMFIDAYVADPLVQIPTDSEMRMDVGLFVEETYLRFYLRLPTPYEKVFLTNMINDDPDLTPELVYTAFANSNEYKFY